MAETRTDILLDENFDIIDEGFEWAEGESDDQHVLLLMITEKGENREFPFVGFGVRNRLKGKFEREKFLRELDVELELDGYTDASVQLGSSILDLIITV